MTDRELLELAAKAAGYTLRDHYEGYPPIAEETNAAWNPLADDGDAFRLASALGLVVDFSRPSAALPFRRHSYELSVGGNDNTATRRAIVRAAAEIGKDMK